MSTILPEHPEPYIWALHLEPLQVLVVVQPGRAEDSPPSVHLVTSATVGTVDQTLRRNGWLPDRWLPRSWGRIAHVDLRTFTEKDPS